MSGAHTTPNAASPGLAGYPSIGAEGAAPEYTLTRRLTAGAVIGRGRSSDYREVAVTAGEPHAVRHDLVGEVHARTDPHRRPGGRGRPLACFGHLTDLQLADVQSPIRFEFFNREFSDPRFAELIPMQRAQEGFAFHAAQSMVDTLNALAGGPVGSSPLELIVTTGDAIDNAQWNELRAFLALLDSGEVRPGSGGPGYHGVQTPGWPDDVFWVPDGADDHFTREWGYRTLPGVLDRAMTAWESSGLRVPWLACYGNHEALVTGVARINDALREAAIGSRKPVRLHPRADRDHALEIFTTQAEYFLSADSATITPDPDRRLLSRRDFVEAHFAPGARPLGHGFTDRNRLEGTAYYAYDVQDRHGVRFVTLDTSNVAGTSDGSIDADQARWLDGVLTEAEVPGQERLVVLLSHHGVDTLTNLRGPEVPGVDEQGRALLGSAAVLALIHRHPSVVLWVNGHTHINAVRPRQHPQEPGRGFWEVTTCSIADWPSQARVIELFDAGEGELSIVCTMLDHAAPPVPDLAGVLTGRLRDLASLHRELGANIPWAGFEGNKAGLSHDRNVELRLRAPFDLDRLGRGPA